LLPARAVRSRSRPCARRTADGGRRTATRQYGGKGNRQQTRAARANRPRAKSQRRKIHRDPTEQPEGRDERQDPYHSRSRQTDRNTASDVATRAERANLDRLDAMTVRTALTPGTLSPWRQVPASIPRPEYVGKKRPRPYNGPHVQTPETI